MTATLGAFVRRNFFDKIFHSYFGAKDWAPQFLVYGDMGLHGGAPTLSRLIDETKSGENTAVLHVGDFAYDFNSEGGMVSRVFCT